METLSVPKCFINFAIILNKEYLSPFPVDFTTRAEKKEYEINVANSLFSGFSFEMSQKSTKCFTSISFYLNISKGPNANEACKCVYKCV